MKEHPILFSAPMVRALLAGTKTQTRRVVKPQPDYICQDGTPARSTDTAKVRRGQMMTIPCPYGQPGDRLWVRETWYFEGTDMMRHGRTHSTQDGVVRYLADGARRTINTRWEAVERWMTRKPQNRPGIHMPRWASRITLEVTAVRVERLQDISEADSIAEGLHYHDGRGIGHSGWREGHGVGFVYDTAREAYADLWRSINGPGSWEANPFVWVIEFRKISNAS